MLVIGLIALFCLITLIDLPGLLKGQHRFKTMMAYLFLLVSGFVISFLQVIGKAPVSPSIVIERMVKFVVKGLIG